MNILAIDSHSPSGSVAISQDRKIKFLSYLNIQGTHSSKLMKMIDQALQNCDLQVKDLQQIVLSIGPGSFTGIRIGLATAKGLAFPHQIPIMPICSLQMRAATFANMGKNIISFSDAKTKEIYAAVYDENLNVLVQAGCYKIENFLSKLSGEFIITGDNYEIIKEHVTQLELTFANSAQNLPLASYLLTMAKPELKFDFDFLSNLEPMYLRKSQAEIVWENKNKLQS